MVIPFDSFSFSFEISELDGQRMIYVCIRRPVQNQHHSIAPLWKLEKVPGSHADLTSANVKLQLYSVIHHVKKYLKIVLAQYSSGRETKRQKA